MTLIIGIDPGLTGAATALHIGEKTCEVYGYKLQYSKDKILYGRDLLNWLTMVLPLSCLEDVSEIWCEKVNAFGMGLGAAYTFGSICGQLHQVLQFSGIRYTLIEPRKWQKKVFTGIDERLKPKEKAKIAAARLFPGEKVPAHGGYLDSLLLAVSSYPGILPYTDLSPLS